MDWMTACSLTGWHDVMTVRSALWLSLVQLIDPTIYGLAFSPRSLPLQSTLRQFTTHSAAT